MANQKIINWIKHYESQGYSPQQLYNSLVQRGYNPDEVNEALRTAAQPATQVNQSASAIKKPVNFLPIIIIGILVVALIGVGIFWFTPFYKKADSKIIHTNIDKTYNLTDKGGNKFGEMNTKIEADIEVKSDCGGMDCFEQKFAECKPATVTYKLTDDIVYYYEIIGASDGLCEVKSRFTAIPNPEWVGKEMICKYDSTKKFETAIEDMSKCKGQLYTLITGGKLQ